MNTKLIKILIVLSMMPGLAAGQTREIDSLKRIVRSGTINRLSAIRSVQRLWQAFVETKQIDSAYRYAQYAARFIPDSTDRASIDTNVVNLLIGLGGAHQFNNLDSAMLLSGKALAWARQIHFRKGEGWASMQLGENYRLHGDFTRALELLLDALRISREVHDEELETNAMLFTGTAYSSLGAYRTGLQYMQEGMTRAYLIRFPPMIPFIWSNIGDAYEKLNLLDSALLMQEKASRMVDSMDISESSLKAQILGWLGLIHARKGNTEKAFAYYRASNDIRDYLNLGTTQYLMGELFHTTKQPDSSLYYARLGYINSMHSSQQFWTLESCRLLARIFADRGMSDSAYYYQRLAFNLRDSFFSPQKFNALQVAAINDRQNQFDIVQEKEKLASRVKVWGLLAALAVFLLIALILYRNNQVREKANRELALKNRELEIASALDRVRTASLSMQHSSELSQVVAAMFRELEQQGFRLQDGAVILLLFQEERKSFTQWIVDPSGVYPHSFEIPVTEHEMCRDLLNAWREGREFLSAMYTKHEKDAYFRFLFAHTPYKELPESLQAMLLSTEHYGISVAMGKQSGIMIPTNSGNIVSEEQRIVLTRMAREFDQAYVRFLDIQRAEAQAREAQIETALEKIRNSSLAMHRTDELKSVIATMHEKLKELSLQKTTVAILTFHEKTRTIYFWIGNDLNENPIKVTLPYSEQVLEHSICQREIWEAMINKRNFYNKEFDITAKNIWFDYVLEHNDTDIIPETNRQWLRREKGLIASLFVEKHSSIWVDSWEGERYTEDQIEVLSRIARVFDQAYVRFLDIQRAEAQAREAQIETALEKIRSRSLAMHATHELKGVVQSMFDQMANLGLIFDGALIFIFNRTSRDIEIWISTVQLQEPVLIHLPYEASIRDNAIYRDVWHLLETGESLLNKSYAGDDKNDYFHHVAKHNLSKIPGHIRDAQIQAGQWTVSYAAGQNCLVALDSWANKLLSAEDYQTLTRFSKVFDQAYTRFLDLQKAEANARAAQVEVALERVRARALAMQAPEELVEVAQTLRQEMGLLGIESLETGTVFIHDAGSEKAECWFAIRDSRLPDKPLVSDHISLDLKATWVGREMLAFYKSEQEQVSIPMRGQHRREWIEYCYSLSPVLNGYYGDQIPERVYHLYKFSNGAIGAAAPGEISAESWTLIQRTAAVFSLAYARFRDLSQARTDLHRLKEEKQRAETALSELKATQAQLIQSEKMASLGELTAGIAHEIQNPLNFVNNFSDLNQELIDELQEELKKGDFREASSIAENLKDNEEKINLHGKRADGIVKSMLQHSRVNSGVKEPTDLNKLTDEYLRLAFHGMRAKDKSFNVTLDTDYDPNLPLVSVLAQDIGRVLLNLFNNAFYAVNEKRKSAGSDYQPRVTVSTRLLNDTSGNPSPSMSNAPMRQCVIRVADNGPGIPDAIKDKIFQPFFTTKPTGQGTGLGLSLSYDIVKAHGGNLKIDRTNDEGSTFSIALAVS